MYQGASALANPRLNSSSESPGVTPPPNSDPGDPFAFWNNANPTLKQLYLRYERGRKTIKGTPQRIADVMEEWFTLGAADGFMMQFATLPDGLEDFVTQVVPELQRRGLFRAGYTGTTLREHLGLIRPANRYAA